MDKTAGPILNFTLRKITGKKNNKNKPLEYKVKNIQIKTAFTGDKMYTNKQVKLAFEKVAKKSSSEKIEDRIKKEILWIKSRGGNADFIDRKNLKKAS